MLMPFDFIAPKRFRIIWLYNSVDFERPDEEEFEDTKGVIRRLFQKYDVRTKDDIYGFIN